jgi:hypothetical protein
MTRCLTLTYQQAVSSPCLSCASSPCCTHLLLRKFKLEDLGDADYLVYLANFAGILNSVNHDGIAQVYLYQPCGQLDLASGLCRVHGTDEQPAICVHYNAHACRYRRVMEGDGVAEEPLLDARRTRWYVEHLLFDEDRRIVGLPDPQEMAKAFAELPLSRSACPRPDEDSPGSQAAALLRPPDVEGRREPLRFSDPRVSKPCLTCPAYCCTRLVFPHDPPANASQLDFFRYCLGFPAVELGITDDHWVVVVRSRCCHLEGSLCTVYGSEDRPLRCGYYDALKCAYRSQFGQARPEGYLRVSREAFPLVESALAFDEAGQVIFHPGVELLRDLLER